MNEPSTRVEPAEPGTSIVVDGELQLLRMVALRNPLKAAARLSDLLHTAGQQPTSKVTADRVLLLAEAWHRGGRIGEAISACREAAAAALQPQDWPRVVTALMVGADLAVCDGQDHAVEACDSAVNAFTYLSQPDRWRLLIASGLRAVAVYHRLDCEQGQRDLAALTSQVPAGHPLGAALAAASDAMRGGCTPGQHHRPVGPPPPLAGAILQPHLETISTSLLTYRVLCWPGKHHHPRRLGNARRADTP
jgi:hypothetical protein